MYIGIDFGTAFSKISTMYLDQPLLLQNPGEYGMPSEFYYDKESGILVGQDALDAGQGTAAANLVSEVKMEILSGRTFTLDGRLFVAKEIVKEIYKALIAKAVQAAKKRLDNTKIEGAVISVPAKFGMQERFLISEAAKESIGNPGIPIQIIKEPVAAAIAYYNTQMESNKYVLVYDLGGGTCDIALVKSDPSVSEHYSVVDSDMLRLGGRNWDEELVKYITAIIENKSGIQVKGNIGFEEKLRRAAVSVKHDLSDPMKTTATARVELNGRIFTAPVSRAKFDEITSHLLQKTFECLQNVYDRNSAACSIEEIICVGGSSNMLQVEEGLLKKFPQCRIRLYEPEHAIVNGAAIYANIPHVHLIDFANFSYGIESNTHYGYPDDRKVVSNILLKGATLPESGWKNFLPCVDNQVNVAFNIYESEFTGDCYDMSEPDKRYIGTAVLELPPEASKSLCLKCQLSLNTDGMLEIEASEPSGKQIRSSFHIAAL